MDAGKDVRPNKKLATQMAKAMENNAESLMQRWTVDNFWYYEQTMELIREGAPVKWTELYQNAVKMGMTRNTNININISRQQDREQLQALVRTRISPRLTDKGEYVDFREIDQSGKPVDTSLSEDGESAFRP